MTAQERGQELTTIVLATMCTIMALLALVWVATEAGTPAASAAEAADEDAGDAAGLRASVTLPESLTRGRAARVSVRLDGLAPVLTPGRTLTSYADGSDPLLMIELDLQLTPAAQGWVSLDPARHVRRASQLPGTPFTLTAFGNAPCATTLGALELRITELSDEGRGFTRTVPLPPVLCSDDGLPPAPESVHVLDPACAREETGRDSVLTAVAVGARRCGVDDTRPVRRTATADDAEEEEADDDDADDDGREGDEPDANEQPEAPRPSPTPEPRPQPRPAEPEPQPQPQPEPQPEPEPQPQPEPPPPDPGGGSGAEGSDGGAGGSDAGDG